MPLSRDTLYTSILRTLISQNDIADITPLFSPDFLPSGHASIKAIVMDMSTDELKRLMARINKVNPEKYALMISMAEDSYKKRLGEMDANGRNSRLERK